MDLASTRFHFDENGGDGKLIVERVQDAEPALIHAAQLRAAGAGKGRDMHHRAHFPAIVVEAYCNRVGITFRDFVTNPEHAKRMCVDPDLAHFRVVG